MNWKSAHSNQVWVVPIESDVIEPGDRAAFLCQLGGSLSLDASTELWMPPEIERAFVVEDVERGSHRLRVHLHCVAERPTAFRGRLYVVFDEPYGPRLEPPS